MTRTITLNAVTLGCLIWFWFNEVDCSRHNDNNRDWIDSEMECRPVSKNKNGVELCILLFVHKEFASLEEKNTIKRKKI